MRLRGCVLRICVYLYLRICVYLYLLVALLRVYLHICVCVRLCGLNLLCTLKRLICTVKRLICALKRLIEGKRLWLNMTVLPVCMYVHVCVCLAVCAWLCQALLYLEAASKNKLLGGTFYQFVEQVSCCCCCCCWCCCWCWCW